MRMIIAPVRPGVTPIPDIEIDVESRDEIPQILLGLQFIYSNLEFREELFKILESVIPPGTDRNNGRPGMELWKIFVIAVLRLNLNCDYDHLLELVNNHRVIRKMLCHADDDLTPYKLQTLKDNVALLTPEILDKINQITVEAGHRVFGETDKPLNARMDSFPVETDVHYPTDTNLLFDAMRVILTLLIRLCKLHKISGWKDGAEKIRRIKNLLRKLQKMRQSNSKDEKRREKRAQDIIDAHEAYLNLAKGILQQVLETLDTLSSLEGVTKAGLAKIVEFIAHAERQMDQIERRVMKGETIPHEEKVFSLFEPHTEWIVKGKAGVQAELGLNVCIIEDNRGFILHHHVMEKETDDKVAVPMIKEAKARFPELRQCSFDKGFHSVSNQAELKNILDSVILPKKGKLSQEDKKTEHSENFINARHQHSAVESAINALEVHGLDRCPDHGIDRFKRYVALAVTARNLQRLGALLQKQETEARQLKKAA